MVARHFMLALCAGLLLAGPAWAQRTLIEHDAPGKKAPAEKKSPFSKIVPAQPKPPAANKPSAEEEPAAEKQAPGRVKPRPSKLVPSETKPPAGKRPSAEEEPAAEKKPPAADQSPLDTAVPPAEEDAVLEEVPLFEQEPFDRITLKEKDEESGQNLVLTVRPLELPERKLPEKPGLRDKLLLYLVDEPKQLYEIEWRWIEKVELFEQLVLDEANALVAEGKLEEAYDYFKFLMENHPKLSTLPAGTGSYLYAEAKALHRQGHYDGALAMLRELYALNPQRLGLDKALAITTEKLVQRYVSEENHRPARILIRNLGNWFPQQAVVLKWEGRWQQEAAALLAKARAEKQSGRLAEAAALSRRQMQIWPRAAGSRELAESLHRDYPRVVVGVSELVVDPHPGRIDDWASRRSSRLVYRTLTEFAGPGPEGGRYECPVGAVSIEDLGRRLVVQLRPGMRWSSGTATLTGYDVSRRLLAMADPAAAEYRVDWGDLLQSVAVSDVYRIDAEMLRTHVRPDALLQTILVPYSEAAVAGQPPPSNGSYVLHSRSEDEVVYRSNPQYFAAVAGQPKEIVERRYGRGIEGLRALKRGKIDVLDRLYPWNFEAIRGDERLAAEPYGLPLVHCLIPNRRRPLLSRRAFRRALLYGIHRRAILEQLTGQIELPGCRVLSGPFPPGLSTDDPIAYGCDETLAPRGYEPHLAIALAGVSVEALSVAIEKKTGKRPKTVSPLVLAHPPNEVAKIACEAIKRQLKLVGIGVVLKQLDRRRWRTMPEGVDLLYAELAMWEPLVDARQLLGEEGICGGCSPYMSLALRQLDEAADWRQVGSRMRRIHRIAFEDVAVVPLWQWTDHFAYRKSVRGIGARPVCLYQNVEQWQVAFQYAAEQ